MDKKIEVLQWLKDNKIELSNEEALLLVNFVSIQTKAKDQRIKELESGEALGVAIAETVIAEKRIKELIAKYQKQWDKNGMGSGISYSALISDLESIHKP